MKKEESKPNTKAGRKPLADPAIHRYDFRLNETDSVKLENMFDLSGYKYRAHFIQDKVLNGKLKIVKIDKVLGDYLILLSQLRGQLKGVGNNYNQVLRLLKERLGEKKALTYLYKLEKATIELVKTHQQVESQLIKLETLWLQR